MKKYSKIGWGLLLFPALVLAGCVGRNAQNQNGQVPAGNSGNNAGQSVAETVKQGLYDLVTKGAGVKCSIDDPKMGPMTMFAKGDKAKVEGFSFMGGLSNLNAGEPPKEEKGTMINDGTWAYMWSGKEGMKFNIKEMESLAPKDQGQDNSQSSASDWKDWVKHMDETGVKYDCSPTVLSDSDFSPPSDVKFQDWGEMMKGFIKMGEDMKNKVPSVPAPPAQ
jgi:hypothetical protein